MELIKAKEVFLKNRRFDLIFKFLYLKYHNLYKNSTNFFEDLYSEHIRAFNNFEEGSPSDGIPKKSKEEFLKRFNQNFENIKNFGFDKEKSVIYLGEGDEVYDGSHRLSICTFLENDAYADRRKLEKYYDYSFFQNRQIDNLYSDYATLEYIKLNHNSYIVNLHSITDPKMDSRVETILSQYGFIYFKKEIFLTFNGYVNTKKISYGFENKGKDSWIGNMSNDFAGAKSHAQKSMGKYPLRVYVFVCDDHKKVTEAKQKIREIYNIGNFSVHINDTHNEAVELAETYFNQNSLLVINSRPYNLETSKIDYYTEEVKQYAKEKNIPLETFCASGSTILGVLGIRECRDFDLLNCSKNEVITFDNQNISIHDSELQYYPHNKVEIIMNPKHHFYYKGLKFITATILYEMKKKRNENPKDIQDITLINNFLKGQIIKRKSDKLKHLKRIIFEVIRRILRKMKKITRKLKL